MKNKNYLIDRLSNTAIFISVITLIFSKIILYVIVKFDFISISLGGGSDANYYDAYALGLVNTATSIWPVLLRFLNENNLYSREVISSLLFFLNLFFVPIIIANISGISFKKHQKYYLCIFLLCSQYITIFYYSIDVYRDAFMVDIFLLGSLAVKKLLKSNNFLSIIFFLLISLLIGVFLYKLRPYLGWAFLVSLLLFKVDFNKKRLILFGVGYFLLLFVANYLGFLYELTEYRSGFEVAGGGSTLGLNFSNPLMFIPNFILSILGQLFGLYITNPLALLLLFLETIPFILMFVFVIKNIKFANNFIRFLIIFFILYGSVWLIGNDNLGTAVRLRIYNYLAIYISFFYILKIKKSLRQAS